MPTVLKAVRFKILRDVSTARGTLVALAEEPIRICTLIDEARFDEENHLIHHGTVFFEDKMHDWVWCDGQLRYFSRAVDRADVVAVFEEAEVELKPKFDAMTGRRL